MWTYYSMHAGNLENCSWTSWVLIIPLITLPLHHYAWEHFMPFLPEEWLVLYKMDARNNCMHRIWDCKSSLVKARKLHGVTPIEVYIGDGSWAEVDWDEVAIHHFVKSPKGLIPPHGYARRDNYSMHAMEWILL